ncbi:hypothetical protein UFOVP449_31 [uncultured Caudovirales phage]|uniref:Uncharacterized protein n=1 Tax=uncultured Caudovirales phage TaxID=2100421 RepID=A0A6J5MEX9_9CAUD|nr:hypothetical protein UFOVP449_31 [uncultured Caudovirales phage]
MKVFITTFNDIYFDTDTQSMNGCTNSEFLRYLCGVHTNRERFITRYASPLLEKLAELAEHSEPDHAAVVKFVDFLVQNYDAAVPFSFKESFELQNREFQALVFSSINISEMITELGATRYKTDGIEVKHRQYDNDGNFTGETEYHNVYEVWEVSGEKLGLNENLYTVKCWCTSTNQEHWLWIEDQYKEDPLEAIASTFRVHRNIIPHIKCLKRHGDILLAEMDSDVQPEGEIVPLGKELYFKLLVAQS